MLNKCPGSGKGLRVSIKKCPKCKEGVEFFSDEIRRKCPKCKTEMTAESTPSCIEWCASSKQCMGERLWKELGMDKRRKK
ncbi:MAG: phosphohydrolase [Candidatus Omnitrophota bacterium]|nr:phosphohydrolase [Candidatus Omnitrophota bacterium]